MSAEIIQSSHGPRAPTHRRLPHDCFSLCGTGSRNRFCRRSVRQACRTGEARKLAWPRLLSKFARSLVRSHTRTAIRQRDHMSV
jgi:hypothetical protein